MLFLRKNHSKNEIIEKWNDYSMRDSRVLFVTCHLHSQTSHPVLVQMPDLPSAGLLRRCILGTACCLLLQVFDPLLSYYPVQLSPNQSFDSIHPTAQKDMYNLSLCISVHRANRLLSSGRKIRNNIK